MKKIFEAPDITKLSLVTEKVTLSIGDYTNGTGVEIGSGDINGIPQT